MNNEEHLDKEDVIRMDLDELSERELDDLAYLVVKKLRESMRQERDRSGR